MLKAGKKEITLYKLYLHEYVKKRYYTRNVFNSDNYVISEMPKYWLMACVKCLK